MKSLAISAAVVICLGISACAGTAGRQGVTRNEPLSKVDYGKVLTVNQWAVKRGATVVWINYPTRLANSKPNDG